MFPKLILLAALLMPRRGNSMLPMPPGPVSAYGCLLELVDNSTVVRSKDTSRPPRRWAITVWGRSTRDATEWSARLPLEHIERKQAMSDCDRWMTLMDHDTRARRNAR